LIIALSYQFFNSSEFGISVDKSPIFSDCHLICSLNDFIQNKSQILSAKEGIRNIETMYKVPNNMTNHNIFFIFFIIKNYLPFSKEVPVGGWIRTIVHIFFILKTNHS
jgi:hypothetical protein